MMKKKKDKRMENLGVLSVRVCGFTEVAPPTFSFHERGGKGEKRNLNSNVYFRFELIEKKKKRGKQNSKTAVHIVMQKKKKKNAWAFVTFQFDCMKKRNKKEIQASHGYATDSVDLEAQEQERKMKEKKYNVWFDNRWSIPSWKRP